MHLTYPRLCSCGVVHKAPVDRQLAAHLRPYFATVTSTWNSPAAAGAMDLATGAILTEAWTDAVTSNFLYLAGTTGVVTQVLSSIFGGAISTVASSLTGTSDSINITPAGGKVIAIYTASFLNTTQGTVNTFGFSVDGAAPAVTSGAFHAPVAGYSVPLCMVVNLGVLTSVAHSVAPYWACSSGTLQQGPMTRCLAVMELRR